MNLFTGSDNILMIGGGFMEDLYVTVTGFANYYHKKPFAIGNVLICVKEPSNKYDSEAITVKLPIIGQGRIYRKQSGEYCRRYTQCRKNIR